MKAGKSKKSNEKNTFNVVMEDTLESQNNIISSTECTGLIQKPPETDAEVDSYKDIYHLPNEKEVIESSNINHNSEKMVNKESTKKSRG